MKKISILFYLLFSIICFGQNENDLAIIKKSQNVVAYAIEGNWKAKDSTLYTELKIINDPNSLKTIPKTYFESIKKMKIFNAGYITMQRKEETYKHPYILTELDGCPLLIYFRKKNSDTINDSESFFLFVATAQEKSNDRLFIGGDHILASFTEYNRTNSN